MRIFVKSPLGPTLALDVESTDTIDTVTEKIEEMWGFPRGSQRIIFAGRELKRPSWRPLCDMEHHEMRRQCDAFASAKLRSIEPLLVLTALKGKDEKKRMLERILQQHQAVERETRELCGLYSEAAGVDAHEARGRVVKREETLEGMNVQHESTLHLVIPLRGGMYHATSGREGFEPVAPLPASDAEGMYHAATSPEGFEPVAPPPPEGSEPVAPPPPEDAELQALADSVRESARSAAFLERMLQFYQSHLGQSD